MFHISQSSSVSANQVRFSLFLILSFPLRTVILAWNTMHFFINLDDFFLSGISFDYVSVRKLVLCEYQPIRLKI